VGLIVGLVALFFAYSRGAWVALILGILTAFIIYKKWMLKVIMMATIIIALLIGWLASNQHYVQFAPTYEQTIFHSNLGEHLSSTTSLKDLSNAERFYRWVAGAKMFAAKPITGFGPNTFYDYYKNYAVDVFKTYVSNNPEHSSVHNYFLLMALEQGFIGLLLFCILLFSVLMYAQQLYHQLQHQLYKTVAIAIGVIIAMIATINMMSDMIETDKIGGLFWLCVGVLIVLSKELKIEQERIA
jgi:O-antigen ligase